MPRPTLQPTDEQRAIVKSMTGFGVPHEQIAKYIGIRSPKTLRKYFREELDRGALEANYKMASIIFKRASKGNIDAAKFFLKCRAGWREHSFAPQMSSAPPPFVVAQDDGVRQP